MKAADAAAYLRSLAFKPGWRVTAEGYRDMVQVSFLIDTVDTSYPDPDGVCRKPITIYGTSKVLFTEDMEPEDLDYEVLKLAAEQDMHENREFLKHRLPDGTWHSPMHPHTRAGNAAWDKRERPERPRQMTGSVGLMQLLGLED